MLKKFEMGQTSSSASTKKVFLRAARAEARQLKILIMDFLFKQVVIEEKISRAKYYGIVGEFQAQRYKGEFLQ